MTEAGASPPLTHCVRGHHGGVAKGKSRWRRFREEKVIEPLRTWLGRSKSCERARFHEASPTGRLQPQTSCHRALRTSGFHVATMKRPGKTRLSKERFHESPGVGTMAISGRLQSRGRWRAAFTSHRQMADSNNSWTIDTFSLAGGHRQPLWKTPTFRCLGASCHL